MGPAARLLLLAAIVANVAALLESVPSPRVQTADGRLRGKYVLTRDSKKIRAFLGVPYAKPPVGDLRFKSAVRTAPWEGERWAVDSPPACIQPDRRHGKPVGQEDCLYLNIYTPDSMSKITKEHLPLYDVDTTTNEVLGSAPMNDSCPLLPVMVYFHGGGFERGSTEPFTHEYLLDGGIVLVTVQYRLGLLGFLSTGDSILPGNIGLKDQRIALQWVHDNIHAFGGCPHRVTIIGDGAGAASVHYHLLLAPPRGALFRAGISMSGTALSPWAFRSAAESRHLAQRVAALAGCPATSQGLLNCLRHRPAEELVDILQIYKNETSGCGVWSRAVPVLGGVLESWTVEDAFLVTSPWERTVSLPWLVGVTSKELLYDFTPHLVDKSDRLFQEVDRCFNETLPSVLGYSWVDARDYDIAAHVREFYMQDRPIKRESLAEVVEAVSDGSTVYPTFEAIRRAQKRSTFLYYYNFLGANTFGATSLDGRVGAGHGDDLFMLFPRPLGKSIPRKNRKIDTALSKKMVTMWTNFVKYLKPTTPDLEGLRWIPIAPSTSYLNIGEETLSVQKSFHLNRMHFWTSVDYPNRDDAVLRDETPRKYNSLVTNQIEDGLGSFEKSSTAKEAINVNPGLEDGNLLMMDNYKPLPYEVLHALEELVNMNSMDNKAEENIRQGVDSIEPTFETESTVQVDNYFTWDWIEVRYNMVFSSENGSLALNDSIAKVMDGNDEDDMVKYNSSIEVLTIDSSPNVGNVTQDDEKERTKMNFNDPLVYFDPLELLDEVERYLEPENTTEWDWVEMKYDLVFTTGSSYSEVAPEESSEKKIDLEPGFVSKISIDSNSSLIGEKAVESNVESILQSNFTNLDPLEKEVQIEPQLYDAWDWIELRYNFVFTTVSESSNKGDAQITDYDLQNNKSTENQYEDARFRSMTQGNSFDPRLGLNEHVILANDLLPESTADQATVKVVNSTEENEYMPETHVEEDVVDIEVHMMIAFDQLPDSLEGLAQRQEYTEDVLSRVLDSPFDPNAIIEIIEEEETAQLPSYIEFDWIEVRYNLSERVDPTQMSEAMNRPESFLDWDWIELSYNFSSNITDTEGVQEVGRDERHTDEEVIERINLIAANQFINTLEGGELPESYNDEGFVQTHITPQDVQENGEGDYLDEYYELENWPRFIPIVGYQMFDFSGESDSGESLEYYEEYNAYSDYDEDNLQVDINQLTSSEGTGDISQKQLIPVFIPVVQGALLDPNDVNDNAEYYSSILQPYWRFISQMLSPANVDRNNNLSGTTADNSNILSNLIVGLHEDNINNVLSQEKRINSNEIYFSEEYNEDEFTSDYLPLPGHRVTDTSENYFEEYSEENYI